MNTIPVSHRTLQKTGESVSHTKSHPAQDFAQRLDKAVQGHPHAPPGHGRQKWLRDLVKDRTGLEVSAEAVRKWFAGEARPRPNVMHKIAKALEVDEAWLSLGIAPTETPGEAKRRNAVADGAVNLVAGLIQIHGGHIAFPDSGSDRGSDIFAIIGGKKIEIEVKLARETGEHNLMFALQANSKADVVIGVIPSTKVLTAKLLWLTPDVITKHGRRKGGYTEVTVTQSGQQYVAGDSTVPQVTSFKNLAA